MVASTAIGHGLLGVFELDEKGRILYSNIDESSSSMYGETALGGADFFTQVTGFANAPDLRRRFDLFRLNGMPAQSFDFTCQYPDGSAKIRIFMVRFKDADACSFLIHLKQP